jgi:hypothetical protein
VVANIPPKENDMSKMPQRIMRESEIPAFVQEVINSGCDICAIGYRGYVLGDIEEMNAAQDELDRIDKAYGDRDFLKDEIIAHLRSLGRYLDPGSMAKHWSDNPRPS